MPVKLRNIGPSKDLVKASKSEKIKKIFGKK